MEQTNEEVKKETVNEKAIIDQLFKEKQQYEQANQDSRTEFDAVYNAYLGKIEDVKDPSRSQEKITKLRTETAYIVPSIFSGNPEFEVEGVGVEDKDLAKILEKIVNARMETITQAYEMIEAWVKQSAVFGTSLMKVCWKFTTKKNEDGTEAPDKDEPYFEVPNIKDCFYNPVIVNIENQNSLIFRSVLSLAEVKNNQAYNFTNAQGELNREKIESGNSSISKYDSSSQYTADGIDQDKASDGTIEIFERITPDRIQTVANGKERLLLRDIENPYGMNVVKLTHEPNAIPNRFEGFGIGQNTLGIGTLYQKLQNKTIDSVALTNNIFTFFAKGTKIDKKQLVVKPGGGCEVDTQGKNIRDVVQFAQFPDILSGAVMLQNKLDDDHKRASGANDLMQGAASNKTLGQDEIASTYSSNRFELINRRFKQSLADVAKLLLKMDLQNLQSPDAEILRIFPDEIETDQIDPMTGQPVMQTGIRAKIYQLLINEAPNVKWNIKVKGNTTVAKNKDRQIQQLSEGYDKFSQILPPKNQMEWAKKFLELRGIDDIDKLIPSEQELMEQQQKEMMQQPM